MHDLANKGPKSALLEHHKVLYDLKNLLSMWYKKTQQSYIKGA